MKQISRLCTLSLAIWLLLSMFLTMVSCNGINQSGVVDAKLNEKGELILIYGDGSAQNLGAIVGEDGVNGVNGVAGRDGSDGM